jgi:SAM-dependent methyltransferase
MPTFRLNPYISFIENRLFPGLIHRGIFHRLTGEILEPSEQILSWLQASELDHSVEAGDEIRQLIQKEFLIPENSDPLARFADYYVTRPIQNPAVSYRSQTGEWILVRNSMQQRVYSAKRDELPPVIEEKLSPMTAEILLLADGARTLQQLFSAVRRESHDVNMFEDSEFRAAIDFLTSQERQLIKFTNRREELAHPFTWVNMTPRNFYHSRRWDQPLAGSSREAVIDFHLQGIEDAGFEFDVIEPTLNHCFRFPHEALGGLDYGSRFCVSTLRPEVVPLLDGSSRLAVLEVGGGTGSFARSFIKQAESMKSVGVDYHILDLSPVLMENQRRMLSELLPPENHFQQDATEFDLPGQTFDLIVSNEVIADFPVAPVRRNGDNEWEGEGAYYLAKYDLSDKDAPDSFVVNAGAFRFIERAWNHLTPGGTLIISEYGAEDMYAMQGYHLNHEEYSIHFGHLAACAAKIGFQTRLLTVKEFLGIDDDVPVLNGREEHLLCLNHVLKNYGDALPYAIIAKSEFEKRCARVVEQTGLCGYSFSPLSMGFHYGPSVRDFLVLILNKPR